MFDVGEDVFHGSGNNAGLVVVSSLRDERSTGQSTPWQTFRWGTDSPK